MREFIDLNKLSDKVFVLKAKKLWTRSYKNLAKRVWKLDEVNKGYRKVIGEHKTFDKLSSKEKRARISGIWKKYIEVLSCDPLLPSELLPKGWCRKKAVRVLEDLN